MKLLVVVMASLLLITPYLGAAEEKGKISITVYGAETRTITRSMNVEEIMEVMNELRGLDDRTASMHSVLSLLKERGLMGRDDFAGNGSASNFLSFVFGYGKGIAMYTADFAFLLLMMLVTGNVLAAIFITAVFIMITHIIPARFILPVSLVGMEDGNITTLGIGGLKRIGDNALLVGFAGVMINFYIPAGNTSISPLFIAGYSLAVLPNPFG